MPPPPYPVPPLPAPVSPLPAPVPPRSAALSPPPGPAPSPAAPVSPPYAPVPALSAPVPPPPGPDAALLARTARWSNEPLHAPRRAAALALLADIDVGRAASAAGRAMTAALIALPYERYDVLPLLRTIPLTVLTTIIGDDENQAIGILLQSRDATAALAARTLTGSPDAPIRWTRRVSDDAVVTVPLESAWFGGGAHACPGSELAQALSAAMVSAVLAGWRPVAEPVSLDPALPNLRLPREVVVERR